MRRFIRKTIALALLTIATAGGCQNAMRVAHMMVEGQGIKRNLDDMNGAVDAEIAAARDVRPK
jgi:hypothetical protein